MYKIPFSKTMKWYIVLKLCFKTFKNIFDHQNYGYLNHINHNSHSCLKTNKCFFVGYNSHNNQSNLNFNVILQ